MLGQRSKRRHQLRGGGPLESGALHESCLEHPCRLQSDANGIVAYNPNTMDWTHFDNRYRVWGKDGSAFPNSDHRDRCTSGNCRIWDFRVNNANDAVLFNRTGAVTTPNSAFVANAACPAEVHGNVATMNGEGLIFLLNAVEIIEPSFDWNNPSKNNGLCESNESCLYTPNFGAYQGEGDAEPCTFTNGTVTGVKMFGYTANGAVP